MKPCLKDVEYIKNKLLEHIEPESIILFGSLASGTENENSDIDLLVIWNDHLNLTHSKRRQLLRKYVGLIDFPLDILTCSNDEFEIAIKDDSSFTHQILHTSEVIYSGFQKRS